MDMSIEQLYPDLPGSSLLPPLPRSQFEELRQHRRGNYTQRTRHLTPEGRARYTNRLFLESSPYLLQHAHNPVQWFPWGEEPFRLARELSRPVLVSIGYATCHWCHVMEEESFEDLDIATFINEGFIAVKVDREERPNIDAVYMAALHAMGSQGGWPLNVFLTPEQQPFYGGTYFPPLDYGGGIGFLTLLRRLRDAYCNEHGRVFAAGEQLTKAVRNIVAPPGAHSAQRGISLERAVEAYQQRFDPENGGLIGAPKFPSSLPIRLLLRASRQVQTSPLLPIVELTLEKMAAGGIYDQVGGGFHRYATDEHWLVPHFEKMLYDNALMALSYIEGYQVLGDPQHATVAKEILRYLKRDLSAPEGGFYAATDADSRAGDGSMTEGLFYTWTAEELEDILGKERSGVVTRYFGVTRTGDLVGRNILHRAKDFDQVAAEVGVTVDLVRDIIEESINILYLARNQRPKPLRDEKILCAWNGLAISAFAKGGFVLDDPAAVKEARLTASFILERMKSDSGLAHSHQAGEAKGEAFLDDYAFLIAGLLDLFEVTAESRWLEASKDLCLVVQRFFEDDAGGFFMTGKHHEVLIAREKPYYDGVTPSGNSVMIMNLLRLHRLTEVPQLLASAQRALEAFSPQLASAPIAVSEMLQALDFMADVPRELVIVAPHGRPEAAGPLVSAARQHYLPNSTIIVCTEGKDLDYAARHVSLLRNKKAENGAAMAYFCENRHCQMPTSDPAVLSRQLAQNATEKRNFL